MHNRRFMSRAGLTRYFARNARRGEEKNKASFFSSPRLAPRTLVSLRVKYLDNESSRDLCLLWTNERRTRSCQLSSDGFAIWIEVRLSFSAKNHSTTTYFCSLSVLFRVYGSYSNGAYSEAVNTNLSALQNRLDSKRFSYLRRLL